MKEVVIRDAVVDDIDPVYLMGFKTFQDKDKFDWGWEKEYMHCLLDPSYGIFHIAEIDEKTVGFQIGVLNYPESSDTQCRILWLYVSPQFRRQGITTKLIKHFLREVMKKGKTSVCADVWGSNTAAQDMVTMLGFKPKEKLIIYQRGV